MTPPLFGRSAESARLDDMLEGVLAGAAGIAFIEGEPGVGKTALLAQLTVHARDRGFTVFAGRGEELEQDRPFRSIAEALGCTRAGSDPRRTEIARMLDGDPEGEGSIYRLIDAIDDVVEAETVGGPVLLTIDDLQWADPGTVRALASVRRRMATLPLAIVATLRHLPRTDQLAALLRATSSQAVVIGLQPLGANAVTELVGAHLGATPGPRLRAHIDGAGGNPFYVLELLDALGAESAIDVEGAAAEIQGPVLPPSLVLTLLNRVSGLPETELEIVRNAAVLGSGFSVEHLATAAGVSRESALAAVTSLRDEGVLTDDGANVRFRHDLIREAIYSDLGEPVRVLMHARIGRALAEAGAEPIEVARHLARGAVTGDVAAADWMVLASADPRLDSGVAAGLIERALDLNPTHPRRIELIKRLARLLTFIGRSADALPRLQQVLPDVSEPTERLAVLEPLLIACILAGRPGEHRGWVREAMRVAQRLGDSTEPKTLLLMARISFFAEDLEGSLALAERAATAAAQRADPAEAEAHAWASGMLTWLGSSGEAATRSERLLSLSRTPLSKSLHWWLYAWALGDLDRIGEAEDALAIARAAADAPGVPTPTIQILAESAYLHFAVGRWDDALVDAETALSVANELEDDLIDTIDPSCIIARIAYHRNDAKPIRWPGPDGTKIWGEDTLPKTLAAEMAFERGEIDDARARARELLIATSMPRTHRRYFDALPTLVRIAFGTGDVDSARMGRDTALRLAERSDAPSIELIADRCVAIVDHDASAASRAVEAARSSPRRLLAAQTFEDVAEMLERNGARDLLTEALQLYAEMGAARDHARVAMRLKELGAPAAGEPVRTRAVSGWEALTPAELDVVRLAADGYTNRQIGSKLFISHHTVATHLAHVFDKLGLRSRVELAREAATRLGAIGSVPSN